MTIAKLKIIPFLRTFMDGACAMLFVAQLTARDSPREQLSLDANWRFHPGDVPLNSFPGVRKPELKAIARVPALPGIHEQAAPDLVRDSTIVPWLGAQVRNITDEGEQSAYGLPSVNGVLVLAVAPESTLAKSGLRKNDVVLSLDDFPTPDTTALLRRTPAWPAARPIALWISRDQRRLQLSLNPLTHP